MKKFLTCFVWGTALLAPVLSFAQASTNPPCQFQYKFTNRTTDSPDGISVISLTGGSGRSPAINNLAQQCNSWILQYSTEGLSAQSLELDSSASTYNGHSSETPLSWSAFGGTTISGSNPSTTTTSGTFIGTGYYPWLSVNVASSTGTGSITVMLLGWKSPSYANRFTPAPVQAMDSNITAASLGTRAICALHTDTGCNNSTTDATSANCPAGTLTAACTFPTSIIIPAGFLGSNLSSLDVLIGVLGAASVPNNLIEVYLDSTVIFAGTASATTIGTKVSKIRCIINAPVTTSTTPISIGCETNGTLGGQGVSFGGNTLLTNSAPAISIDTTIQHTLKISVSYSSNTTGNMAWLYGMKLVK